MLINRQNRSKFINQKQNKTFTVTLDFQLWNSEQYYRFSSIFEDRLVIKTRMFQSYGTNDIMQVQTIRQKNKVLKVFKQIEEEQTSTIPKFQQKKTHDLQNLHRQIRLQNMKSYFYKKLTTNNVYQQPCQQELLNQTQKDQKRLLKWQGYHVKHQRYVLSIFYLTEMIFLVFTFVLSSFMSCIDKFDQTHQYDSFPSIFIILLTMILCLMKIFFFSILNRIHQGIELHYISDIFLNYVRTWVFYVDFVYLWIVLLLFLQMFNTCRIEVIEEFSAYLFGCCMVRIVSSKENLNFFRITFINSFIKDQFYKLIKLTIFNWLLAHFVASILLSMYFIDKTQNWLIAKNLTVQEWYVQYMWAFYWAATIMTSVGFGDYSATTHKQAYIVAFLQIISCIVLAYNITQLGNIVYAMRLSEQQYIAKIATFKRMSEQNQTNPELRTKIQSYIREQKEIKEKYEFNQQTQILNSLPQSLRKQFLLQSNNRVFRSLPFFKSLKKNTLVQLAQSFTSKVQYPGEVLVRANHHNQNIIILKEGFVGLVYSKIHSSLNGIIVQEIKQQEGRLIFEKKQKNHKVPVLLTVEFLSPGKVINYDITVLKYSFVTKIKVKNFFEVIKASNIDSEYFFSIIHSYQAHDKQWFQLICQKCSYLKNKINSQKFQNSTSHFNGETIEKIFHHNKFDCPKLHFIPWRKIIIIKYLKAPGVIQEGTQIYNRKKYRLESCLILRKKIFNKYQTKRFINEKKNFKRSVQKSHTIKEFNFRKLSKKKSSYSNSGNFVRKTTSFGQDSNYGKKSLRDIRSPIIKEQQQEYQIDGASEEEQVKTMIEEVIKTTVEEIGPKNITLTFWDLQIDIMYNYRNYFPLNNSSLLDNFSLCNQYVIKRKKALTLLGEALRKVSENPTREIQNCDLLEIQSSKKNSKEDSYPQYSIPSERVNKKQLFRSFFNSQSKILKNSHIQSLGNQRYEVNFDHSIDKNRSNGIHLDESQTIFEEKLSQSSNL